MFRGHEAPSPRPAAGRRDYFENRLSRRSMICAPSSFMNRMQRSLKWRRSAESTITVVAPEQPGHAEQREDDTEQPAFGQDVNRKEHGSDKSAQQKRTEQRRREVSGSGQYPDELRGDARPWR